MNHSSITPGEVRQLARLACLQLDDAEVDSLACDLSTILRSLAVLHHEHLDEHRDDPFQGHGNGIRLRQDELRQGLSREETLEQSGRSLSDGVVVPCFHPRASKSICQDAR